MKKCINEFAAVKTTDDYVLCCEFDDGSVKVSYERHRVAPGKVEVVQHDNRDRNGNYYTTRKIIDSDIVVCEQCEQTDAIEWEREHILMLVKSVYDHMEQFTGSPVHCSDFRKTVAKYIQNHINTPHKKELGQLIFAYNSIPI